MVEKGALEDDSQVGEWLRGGLECWWCYRHRKPGLKDNQTRGERVMRWQNLLSYVTLSDSVSSCGASSWERREKQKNAYYFIHKEQKEYMAAGVGSVDSKVSKFQDHDAVVLSRDQYIGIKRAVYD